MKKENVMDVWLDAICKEQERSRETVCPRCGKNKIVHPLCRNALSRIDSRVYVCKECGLDEFMCGEGKANKVDAFGKWYVVREFFGIKV